MKGDHEAVSRHYRRQMVAEPSGPHGVLVVNDMAFPKKGRYSVWVARQYCGSQGKVANWWYGDVPAFRKGLDEWGEQYVVGVYSDTEVFLDPPVLVEPQPKKRGRGRARTYPTRIKTHPPPVKVTTLGAHLIEDEWEHLELR